MSDVRNLTTGGMERLMDDLPRPDRGRLVSDLAALVGRQDISVSEGRLKLSVPISVALDHVMSSALITAASLIRVNAETIVRAAAVLDAASFEVWVLNAGHLPDPSAQGFELGAHGAALRHGIVGLGQEMQGDGTEEGPRVAVLLDDAPGEQPDQLLHHVAEDHLVAGKALSGSHPEPLVPRRSTPPP
ncbi:hypothetical protein [Xanthobacter aminoxidans]|uniref:hypothetical protein n=1 Tax=Xanthobacter aminoxidans TaxID=186280 RepID=UPI0020230548|nr:hypothetical protein [Xanthobacter aminoxidans]MCL8385540.1 hypothetical protein [Xanthobacter aminoxidans]